MSIVDKNYHKKTYHKYDHNKWVLIIYVKSVSHETNIDKFFYENTIDSLDSVINISSICLYTLNDQLSKILVDIKPKCKIPINLCVDSDNDILNTMKLHLDNNLSIIYFTNNTGFSIQQKQCHSLDCLSAYTTCIYDDLYSKVLNKFGLSKLITFDTLVVPNNNDSRKFIDNCIYFCRKLIGTDNEFKINLSLTITDSRMGYIVKDLETDLEFPNNNFIRNIVDKSFRQYLTEQFCLVKNNFKKCELPWKDDNFIYYPYLDMNVFPCDESVQNISYTSCNTNGFITNETNPFGKLFTRFNNPYEGVYLKKPQNNIQIPKHLHHIWIDEEPSINYINLWKTILVEPWKYTIWDNNSVLDLIKDTHWDQMYNCAKQSRQKQLIAMLSILEKYGGITINAYNIPLKSLDSLTIGNKFFVSFLAEDTGTSLSYRIIGSLPGGLGKNMIDPNISRKPYEGINNFFRSVNYNKTNDFVIPEIFDKLKSLLHVSVLNSNNTHNNFSKEIDYFLLSLSGQNIFIYPSYYFNANISTLPKRLSNKIIMINLQKYPDKKPIRIKTEVHRPYVVTKEAIADQLNENPKDKLKNIK
ncbi:putative glycosyltransferase [Acanthamoeba polyphaga mimivirus]|nr:putative glycosyltransferase [Mimivirus reunion]WMV61614.1 putative glycosyltransferase [Mimivirus sp.]WMV62591.1 putative glycosyltransferase [Acanthamoeba polyphaga mimivirus]WMV63568.1 putative glycosyltransferase [Mimivirus sp.]